MYAPNVRLHHFRRFLVSLAIPDFTELICKIFVFSFRCVTPITAVKCNDSPVVLQTLAMMGTGFDCASKAEISKVLNFGVAPEAIIYANPTKPISHLNFAAETNVTVMTVDSEFEMQKIAKHFPHAR